METAKRYAIISKNDFDNIFRKDEVPHAQRIDVKNFIFQSYRDKGYKVEQQGTNPNIFVFSW
jgi:hypothetical protein